MERLRLMGQLPSAVDLEIPQDVRDAMPLVADIANAVGKVKYHGDTFSVVSYASVVDALGRYYPLKIQAYLVKNAGFRVPVKN
ncbi:MAG: hypothetical protein LBU19_06195 [Treponema sp.]|nr:hypothetical protein [Treponema sp.]